MTKSPERERCRWCGRGLPDRPAPAAPAFCRQACRQAAYVAGRRREELGLTETELIVTRQALDELRDRLYVLEAAMEDVERDLGEEQDERSLRDAVDWLLVRRQAPGRTAAQLYVTCIMGVREAPRPAGSGQPVRAIRTLQGALWATRLGTLPRRRAAPVHALVAHDDEVGSDRLGDRAEARRRHRRAACGSPPEPLARGGRSAIRSRSALAESTTSPWSGTITISGPMPTVGIGHADTRCRVALSCAARSAAMATAPDDRSLRSVPTTIRSTLASPCESAVAS